MLVSIYMYICVCVYVHHQIRIFYNNVILLGRDTKEKKKLVISHGFVRLRPRMSMINRFNSIKVNRLHKSLCKHKITKRLSREECSI